jgi:hypothetical protein
VQVSLVVLDQLVDLGRLSGLVDEQRHAEHDADADRQGDGGQHGGDEPPTVGETTVLYSP